MLDFYNRVVVIKNIKIKIVVGKFSQIVIDCVSLFFTILMNTLGHKI